MGLVGIRRSGFLECVDGGKEWVYVTALGNAFCTFHIITIILNTATSVKVFYKIPIRDKQITESELET